MRRPQHSECKKGKFVQQCIWRRSSLKLISVKFSKKLTHFLREKRQNLDWWEWYILKCPGAYIAAVIPEIYTAATTWIIINWDLIIMLTQIFSEKFCCRLLSYLTRYSEELVVARDKLNMYSVSVSAFHSAPLSCPAYQRTGGDFWIHNFNCRKVDIDQCFSLIKW